MVSIDQFKTGVLKYIDEELLPHIPGWKKYATAAYIALAAENVTPMILQMKDHPAIAILGLFDKSNNIDIDKAYKAISSSIKSGEKFDIEIPVIGKFTLDITDIDKIYKNIKEA